MTLTLTPTSAAQRLDELDLAIRQLTVLAESAHPRHRHFLNLEAIALEDELWRLQLRRAKGTDGRTLLPMIENVEGDIERLRNRLDQLDPQAFSRPHPMAAEPIAA